MDMRVEKDWCEGDDQCDRSPRDRSAEHLHVRVRRDGQGTPPHVPEGQASRREKAMEPVAEGHRAMNVLVKELVPGSEDAAAGGADEVAGSGVNEFRLFARASDPLAVCVVL